MPEFPVDVVRTPDGDYAASLADLENGPIGRGVDPYAAYQNLEKPAQKALAALHDEDDLPEPSPANDRPVLMFSASDMDALRVENARMKGTINQVGQKHMICYSWTNDVMFLNP